MLWASFLTNFPHILGVKRIGQGGESLQKVYFQHDAELMYGCDVLFQHEKMIHFKWEKVPYWGNVLLFERDDMDMKALVHSFVKIYLTFRLGKRIKKIAQETYYYTSEADLQTIYDTTVAILQDRTMQATLFPSKKTLADLVFDLFANQLSNMQDIHFDAIVLFSMKPLDRYLIQAVGFGIDEMKREEAYQQFIVDARVFVTNRPTKMEELHIVSRKGFSFYGCDGTLYSKEELHAAMRQTPLYMIQLHEEYDLSPVIALAPKQIHYYGEQPYEGKVYTLYSIFQERMYFHPLQHFPFSHRVK